MIANDADLLRVPDGVALLQDRGAIEIVGGIKGLRISGPTNIPLCRDVFSLLDGAHSLGEIVARFPQEAHSKLLALLHSLDAVQLLAHGEAADHPVAAFFERFQERSLAPTSLRQGVSSQATSPLVHLDGGFSALEDEFIRRCLHGNAIRTMLGHSSAMEVPEALLLERRTIRGYELALWEVSQGQYFLRAASARGSPAPSDYTALAMAAHWVSAWAAGTRSPPKVTPHGSSTRFEVRRPAQTTTDQDLRQEDVLHVACRFGAGLFPGTNRRVAPGAGGLNSVHAFVGLGDDDRSYRYYDPATASLHPVRRVSDSSSLDYSAADFGVDFVSITAGLEHRYGNRSPRLASYDVGTALAFAHAASKALGFDASIASRKRGTALPELLRRTSRRGQIYLAERMLISGADKREASEAVGRTIAELQRRRSQRSFASRGISQAEATACEDSGMRRVQEALATLDPKIRVVRMLRAGREFHCHCVAGSTVTESFSVSEAALRKIIRQPLLLNAPLIYLVLHPEIGLQWSSAAPGFICSSLWLAAHRLGLVGVPYAGAENIAVQDRFVAPQALALCLGAPIGSNAGDRG